MSARRWLLRGLFLLSGAWLVLEGAAWALLRARVEQPLAWADRMEVSVDGATGTMQKRITDPAAIARVRAFIDARPGRWSRTWHTPPATQVHVTFYEHEQVHGWFASGTGFFQAPARGGQAAMRVATPSELEELNRLLGLSPGSHLLR